jgi:hypothetical protein
VEGIFTAHKSTYSVRFTKQKNTLMKISKVLKEHEEMTVGDQGCNFYNLSEIMP